MIIQGSNLPITVTFDQDITDIPLIVATLWAGQGSMIKRWDMADMEIEGDTATLPISEEETSALPCGFIALDVKGLDEDRNTIFWDEASIRVLSRRDKGIALTGE